MMRWRCGARLAGFVLMLLPVLAPPLRADDLDAAIGRLNYAGFNEKQHCTATLVAPQVVLTARHCLVEGEIAEMHVLLGYDRGDWREHLRPLSAQSDASPDDVALLCLDEASTAAPVPIATRPAERGETVVVIGYGRPNVYIANRTTCHVLNVDNEGTFLLDCALTPGTSGGPVLRATDAGYEILGVLSGTSGTASVGQGVVAPDGLAACGVNLAGR